MSVDTSGVSAAADRLRRASESRMPCAPVRDLLGSTDTDVAYQVQTMNVRRSLGEGNVVIGRKIGLTSEAVQAQLGVAQPDYGFLLSNMSLLSGGSVPAGRLLQPRVEAEVAFWLKSDLRGGALESIDDVRTHIESASAAIEIVDSRIAGWNISIVDTIADNASSGLFVMSAHRVPLSEFEPVNVTMRLDINGQTVSTGTGAACLGDPLQALLWLARAAHVLGAPLRAGEVVLSGALGPMVSVLPGDTVHAEISELGTVDVTFANGSD